MRVERRYLRSAVSEPDPWLVSIASAPLVHDGIGWDHLAPTAPSFSAFHGGSAPGMELRVGCELWQAPTAETALGRMLQLNVILNTLKQHRAAEWGPSRPPPGMESPEPLVDSCCCARILLQEVVTAYVLPNMLSISSKSREGLCGAGCLSSKRICVL